MRRWILYLSVLLVLFCLSLVGFGSWLLQSTNRTAWLIEVVADVSDVSLLPPPNIPLRASTATTAANAVILASLVFRKM